MNAETTPTPWDMGDPAFDVTSPEVHRAREDDWYVETTWGWAVLRYAEVSALLRDRRFRQGNARWPAQNGIHSGLFSDWWQETLLSLEGDDHARIRRLMVPAFKNRVIAQMRPTFQAIANELIDAFAPRGHVEFVHEFAEPYAARIICLLLGLPQDHSPQVARWADDLGASFSIDVGNQVPRIETALKGLAGYVDEVVADRRAHPRDDLVTTLVGAEQLTDRELSVALVFLAFAGMETTRNQLGLALQTLLAHPDQWALLAERPELGGNAVEEVMRVNPTVTWVTREALEDVEFQGLRIPKGGIVQMLSHSAGTDPRAVPDPSFDITEQRPPHHGFGAGIHHCLGHFVARTDMAVALPLLAQRMPDAECDGPGAWLPVSGNTGAVSFPIRFRPNSDPGGLMLAITGSTGAVGGRVARALADDMRNDFRLVVRDPSRAPDFDTDVRVCDYADHAAALGALRGVDTLFMVSAAEAVDRRDQHRSFIRAAADAGVGHIVYTSFAGAAPDATFTLGRDHWDAEEAIRESGMTYTILRDNFYSDLLPHFADREGVIRGPAGDGRVAAVARADVADVAVAVLRAPADHADATYVLTGPEALTLTEVAARAGAVLGRELRFEDETVEEAYASRRAAYGAEDWQLDAWVSTYTAIKDGSAAHVSGDVERVSGHPARTLEEAIRESRET